MSVRIPIRAIIIVNYVEIADCLLSYCILFLLSLLYFTPISSTYGEVLAYNAQAIVEFTHVYIDL